MRITFFVFIIREAFSECHSSCTRQNKNSPAHMSQDCVESRSVKASFHFRLRTQYRFCEQLIEPNELLGPSQFLATEVSQVLIPATEWRQRVAHGVSRGNEWENAPVPGGATEYVPANALSPLRGLTCGAPFSHGSRRGLLSPAAPQLALAQFCLCKKVRCARTTLPQSADAAACIPRLPR